MIRRTFLLRASAGTARAGKPLKQERLRADLRISKEMPVVRVLAVAVLMALGGCDVASEPDKDQVTVKYDEERIRKTAAETRRTAEDLGTSAANIAKGTARVIKDEVGDVDADVKVNRDRPAPKE